MDKSNMEYKDMRRKRGIKPPHFIHKDKDINNYKKSQFLNKKINNTINSCIAEKKHKYYNCHDVHREIPLETMELAQNQYTKYSNDNFVSLRSKRPNWLQKDKPEFCTSDLDRRNFHNSDAVW